MGLFTSLVTFPLAPLRGTIAVAEQILKHAEEEYYNPGNIRRQLEQIDELRSDGELSADEAAELEEDLVGRLLEGRARQSRTEG